MISGFQSDLSITRKTNGNFGNVSAGVCFPKSRINENGGKTHVEIIVKVILVKLFLDLVFSSSTDDVIKQVSWMFPLKDKEMCVNPLGFLTSQDFKTACKNFQNWERSKIA